MLKIPNIFHQRDLFFEVYILIRDFALAIPSIWDVPFL